MIYRLDAGIFYSELLFEASGEEIRIDSRTSDAVALALRYGSELYTTPEIIQKAGVLVSQEIREQQSIHNNVVNVEKTVSTTIPYRNYKK